MALSTATGVLGFFAKASLMSLADDFESAVRISVGVFGLPANAFWRTPVFLSLPRIERMADEKRRCRDSGSDSGLLGLCQGGKFGLDGFQLIRRHR